MFDDCTAIVGAPHRSCGCIAPTSLGL